jgi:hypothetical protein
MKKITMILIISMVLVVNAGWAYGSNVTLTASENKELDLLMEGVMSAMFLHASGKISKVEANVLIHQVENTEVYKKYLKSIDGNDDD